MRATSLFLQNAQCVFTSGLDAAGNEIKRKKKNSSLLGGITF